MWGTMCEEANPCGLEEPSQIESSMVTKEGSASLRCDVRECPCASSTVRVPTAGSFDSTCCASHPLDLVTMAHTKG